MMTEYIKEERTVIFGKVFQHYAKSIWQEVSVILYEIYFEICEDPNQDVELSLWDSQLLSITEKVI